MLSPVEEFFQPRSKNGPGGGNFHDVKCLDQDLDMDWAELKALAPNLPRGWFELSKLTPEDRIEFSRDYWLTSLPYQPECNETIPSFFERLDDIKVYVTQEAAELPYEAQMVYCLKGNQGFFHAYAPASEATLAKMQLAFPETILPPDYMAFLRIHDGFSKSSDTGIIRAKQMAPLYRKVQKFLAENDPIELPKRGVLNPHSLIPFYESFGLHCYQCFCYEWYPEHEMGNVYYSGIEKTVSTPKRFSAASETLAFPTFLDWLVFYLEGVE